MNWESIKSLFSKEVRVQTALDRLSQDCSKEGIPFPREVLLEIAQDMLHRRLKGIVSNRIEHLSTKELGVLKESLLAPEPKVETKKEDGKRGVLSASASAINPKSFKKA